MEDLRGRFVGMVGNLMRLGEDFGGLGLIWGYLGASWLSIVFMIFAI